MKELKYPAAIVPEEDLPYFIEVLKIYAGFYKGKSN
jgi:hypothetical protein